MRFARMLRVVVSVAQGACACVRASRCAHVFTAEYLVDSSTFFTDFVALSAGALRGPGKSVERCSTAKHCDRAVYAETASARGSADVSRATFSALSAGALRGPGKSVERCSTAKHCDRAVCADVSRATFSPPKAEAAPRVCSWTTDGARQQGTSHGARTIRMAIAMTSRCPARILGVHGQGVPRHLHYLRVLVAQRSSRLVVRLRSQLGSVSVRACHQDRSETFSRTRRA